VFDKAQKLLENADPNDRIDPTDPIAALAWANIHISQGDKKVALEKLKNIAQPPKGILGDLIGQITESLQSGQEQAAPAENAAPAQPAPMTPAMKQKQLDYACQQAFSSFDDQDLRIPFEPEKFVRCSLRLKKDTYNYDDPIIAQLFVVNMSRINLAIGPGCFLDPHVLVTAEVTTDSGSAPTRFVLTHRYLLQKRVLEKNRSNTITEALNIGPLRNILQKHPQQSYKITFHIYLDPVFDEKGGITSRIPALQPAPVTITRKAFVPTRKRLKAQFDFLAAGSGEERIRAVGILGGIMREAALADSGKVKNPIRPINAGTRQKIRTLIAENLKSDDFRVSAWSAYSLRALPLSATSTEAQQLADLLSGSHWFTRFMAMHATSTVADISEYLVWTKSVEQNEIVKRQALLMQNKPWEIIEAPIELPPENTEETP